MYVYAHPTIKSLSATSVSVHINIADPCISVYDIPRNPSINIADPCISVYDFQHYPSLNIKTEHKNKFNNCNNCNC